MCPWRGIAKANEHRSWCAFWAFLKKVFSLKINSCSIKNSISNTHLCDIWRTTSDRQRSRTSARGCSPNRAISARDHSFPPTDDKLDRILSRHHCLQYSHLAYWRHSAANKKICGVLEFDKAFALSHLSLTFLSTETELWDAQSVLTDSEFYAIFSVLTFKPVCPSVKFAYCSIIHLALSK